MDVLQSIAKTWFSISSNSIKARELETALHNNKQQLALMEAEERNKKEMLAMFRNKMYLHLIESMDTVRKMNRFSETLNIKTIVEAHVNQFIYSAVHQVQRCFHDCKRNGQVQCKPGCEYGDLIIFFCSHKSDNLVHKMRELWIQM